MVTNRKNGISGIFMTQEEYFNVEDFETNVVNPLGEMK
jgi:hypothetical protein